MKQLRNILVMSLLLLGIAATSAFGATPTAFVQSILDKVMAIQNNPALEGPGQEKARAQAIRQIIEKNFDFPSMAEASLGATYNTLSAGQRQEFTQTFASLFQASYTNLVLKFLKQETVKYGKDTQGRGQARVPTTLVRANDTISVEYLLHQRGGDWLLYDVIVDGVSILEKYQSGFAREIKANSFPSLLEKMKTQLKATE